MTFHHLAGYYNKMSHNAHKSFYYYFFYAFRRGAKMIASTKRIKITWKWFHESTKKNEEKKNGRSQTK